MPAIIQFLGYNPLPAASSLPEHLSTAQGAWLVAAEDGREAGRRSGNEEIYPL